VNTKTLADMVLKSSLEFKYTAGCWSRASVTSNAT